MTLHFLNKWECIKALHIVNVRNIEVLVQSSSPLCKDSQINVRSMFVHEVSETGTWPGMIRMKCVVVETTDNLYITPLPNPYERD